jgi:hypothetical protein
MPSPPGIKIVKVRDLIADLKGFPQDARVLLSGDDDLNNLFSDVQAATLAHQKKKTVVLWGNSGSEVETE